MIHQVQINRKKTETERTVKRVQFFVFFVQLSDIFSSKMVHQNLFFFCIAIDASRLGCSISDTYMEFGLV